MQRMQVTCLVAVLPAIGLLGCSDNVLKNGHPPAVSEEAEPTQDASVPPTTVEATAVSSDSVNSKKLALLVGINDYAAESVVDLQGCVSDVQDMKNLLVGKFDFPSENIVVLTNEQATHEGIVRHFRSHLIDRAGRDSIVVFHYSGHGSQMKDVSGDELADGKDETLVPHDSRTQDVFDISDDELNGLFTQLTAKTKHVTFILDSCHSGGGARAVGGGARFVRMDQRVPPAAPPHARSDVGDVSDQDQRFENRDYVLISGCRSNERSYEYNANGQLRGTLTYFLIREILAAGSTAVTYRDIMDQVKGKVNAIHSTQHPQLEGANMDNFVFTEQNCLAQPYVLAAPQGERVKLLAGRVVGLTEGSSFDIYQPGTKRFDDPQEAIAQIELTSVKAFTSTGKIVAGGPIPPGSRAVERVHSFESQRFPIFIDSQGISSTDAIANSAALKRIRSQLVDNPRYQDHFQLVDVPPAGRLVVSERADETLLMTAGPGTSIDSPPVPSGDSDAVARVLDQIVHWAKWFNVLDLENTGTGLTVEYSIEGPQLQDTVQAFSQVFRNDDEITLTLKNTANRPLYFAILDLASDGSIEVIYPQSGDTEQIEPGNTWRQSTRVFVPSGQASATDYLKLLAFDAQVDISFLRSDAAPRSAEQQGGFFPLANAMMKTRGRRVRPIRRDSWFTSSRVLRVVAE